MVLICKFDDLWRDYFVIVIINSEFSFKFQTMMRNYEMKNLIRVYYKTTNLLLCLLLPADYMLKVGVSNFRNAWESMGDEWQQIDNSEMHGWWMTANWYPRLENLSTLWSTRVHQTRVWLGAYFLKGSGWSLKQADWYPSSENSGTNLPDCLFANKK